MSEFKAGQYFDMVGPTGDRRGRFKVLHTHLTGKAVTYRPARWHERFWLWITRRKISTQKLDYGWTGSENRNERG